MYLLGIFAHIPVVVGVVVYIPDEVEVLIAQRVWEHDREAIMQQIKAATIVQTAWVRGGEGRKRKEGSEGRKGLSQLIPLSLRSSFYVHALYVCMT